MKKKNKLNNFVIIGSIYFTILLTISIAYSFFNTDLSIKTLSKKTSDNISEYTLVNSHKTGGTYYYHYTVNFKYIDTIPTIGWEYYIKIPYDTEIVGCFNAECVVKEEVLTITNNKNNGVLSSNNQAVSFSFQMKTNNNNYSFKNLGIKFITDNTDKS